MLRLIRLHIYPKMSRSRSISPIFLSLRFEEAQDEALCLQAALQERGIDSFFCGLHDGERLADEIAVQLTGAKLVIVFGTKTYGRRTASPFSSNQELHYIMSSQKPFLLLRMCDSFEEPLSQFYLTKDIKYFEWFPGMEMHPDLVDRIVDRLSRVGDAKVFLLIRCAF
jgi:hypothetical protein